MGHPEHVPQVGGDLDIALISLVRDAMLRVSEAADLTWKDIETEADGSGRLLIRRSKTDPEALRHCVEQRCRTAHELSEYARICRVSSVMRPYMRPACPRSWTTPGTVEVGGYSGSSR